MMEWFIIGAVAAGAIKGAKEDKKRREEWERQSKTLWFGHMGCNSCGYQWTSRKATPPARRAGCRSNNLGVILGP